MENWIIAKCYTAGDGIEMKQFVGTEEEVKEILAGMAVDDASENKAEFEYGTVDASEVGNDCFGSLYAYGCYSDYHIDYSARRLADIQITK